MPKETEGVRRKREKNFKKKSVYIVNYSKRASKRKIKEQKNPLNMISRNLEVTIVKIGSVKYFQYIDKMTYSVLPLFSL